MQQKEVIQKMIDERLRKKRTIERLKIEIKDLEKEIKCIRNIK